jgi:hypothetical protein
MSDPREGILDDWETTSEQIRQVMGQAIRKAVVEHRKAGMPVATISAGRVVVIVPGDLSHEPPEIDAVKPPSHDTG